MQDNVYDREARGPDGLTYVEQISIYFNSIESGVCKYPDIILV